MGKKTSLAFLFCISLDQSDRATFLCRNRQIPATNIAGRVSFDEELHRVHSICLLLVVVVVVVFFFSLSRNISCWIFYQFFFSISFLVWWDCKNGSRSDTQCIESLYFCGIFFFVCLVCNENQLEMIKTDTQTLVNEETTKNRNRFLIWMQASQSFSLRSDIEIVGYLFLAEK